MGFLPESGMELVGAKTQAGFFHGVRNGVG